MEEVDVLVIGGGIVGRILMNTLPSSLRTLLVDDKPIFVEQKAFDARSIALSQSSIQILKQLDVWSVLEKTPIQSIHISEKGQFGHACLSREDKPLGVVVEMSHLNQHCVVDKARTLAPAKLMAYNAKTQVATIKIGNQERLIHANIVVGADGADSTLRAACALPLTQKDYHQQALVANIGLLRSHRNWAYERFTENGPLAMLPMSGDRSALIWVNDPGRTAFLNQLSDDLFLKTLQASFGYRLGRLIKVGRRSIFPLVQKVMPQTVKDNVVFIGNAAHTLHPIAGQGLNLGLRDAAMLAQCLRAKGSNKEALLDYQQLHSNDERIITWSTDALIRLFGAQFPGLSVARGLGLLALDNSVFLKKMVSRYASGYGGVVPDLVCGIAPQA